MSHIRLIKFYYELNGILNLLTLLSKIIYIYCPEVRVIFFSQIIIKEYLLDIFYNICAKCFEIIGCIYLFLHEGFY